MGGKGKRKGGRAGGVQEETETKIFPASMLQGMQEESKSKEQAAKKEASPQVAKET